MLAVDEVREVIAEIDEAAVGGAADEVGALIHSPPEAMEDGWRLGLKLPEKGVALHPRGRFHPREAEHRGREIDKAHQPLRLAARLILRRAQCLEFLRDVNNQRNLQARIPRPALAPRHP